MTIFHEKAFIFDIGPNSMSFENFVDKYLDKIKIDHAEFVPVDDATHDSAYLLLLVPLKMLREYQELKGREGDNLPDGAEFWKETLLVKKLRSEEFEKRSMGREPLYDILDFLEGDVWGNYQKMVHPADMIRLDITEVPEFHPD